MKLVKLLVTNFRSIAGTQEKAGVEIDLDNINIVFLVGQNNVGKSNVLKAYEYFVSSNMESTECDFYKKDVKNKIVIEGWIKAETEDDCKHQAMIKSMDKETKIARFKKEWDKIGEKGSKYTYDVETNKWAAGGAGGFDPILQNACPDPIWLKGLDSVQIVFDNVQKMVKEKVMSRIEELPRFKIISDELDKLRQDIINDEYTRKIESKLTELMEETFSQLKVTLFGGEKKEFSKEVSNFINTDINITNKDCNFDIDMNNNGHGIRRQFLFNTLRGLSDVFSELSKAKKSRDNDLIEGLKGTNKTKMLLIEEPELFLHPQSVRMFADTLYKLVDNSEFQIMAATHSPIIVDLSREHTTILRCTSSSEMSSIVNQVKYNLFEGEEKERMKMLNTFNPYVCEAFFSDNVILVEGDTESVVYREILNMMVEEGTLDIKNVPLVVNCGSKMNIPSFQKVLRHFNIRYFVIHDLDDTYDKNGDLNPAWTLNKKIFNEIEAFDTIESGSARRYVMERNFESAHKYSYKTSLGKPLSAYRLVHSWNISDTTIPAIQAIKMCIDNSSEYGNFDMEWVHKRITPNPEAAVAKESSGIEK
ncbi:ATP-dependent nuclease [Clostridium botulinum]|uniref:ATP-dependent nuclease n=1 Tax=Clostridium botulinum TaxID=1491 RepID=UPI001FD6C043|nr:AAA family ATPase [Clostridium botulinum]MCJ8172539.1 AAA family ATPase [Clostridium botulinum]